MSEISIQPGLLVSLRTNIRGSVSYYKAQLEFPHLVAGGEEQSKWETTKMVVDPEEHERACKVRNKASSLIRSVCTQSAFGLLCREDRAEELSAKLAEARELVADFNGEATFAHVSVNVIYGRVARDDVEAVKAIGSEIRDLLQDVQVGLADLDVKSVRATCDRLRNVGQILTDENRTMVDIAVRAARAAATRIVKAGEEVAIEIDRSAIRTVGMARTSFLDWDDAVEVAAPQVRGRALDMEEVA